MGSDTKLTRRDILEGGALVGGAAATGYVARKGIITAKGEFRAMLRENAPIQKLESHKHLKRATKKMASIPETHKRPGFGTDEFFAKRKYKVNGRTVTGDAKLIEHLQKVAPKLGYTDAGMQAPRGIAAATGRIATLVIGPPAAGKSTVANELARAGRAAIVDPDVIKKAIPEFKRGIGANAVHEESSKLTAKWLNAHIAKGHNVVVPRTGDVPAKLISTVKDFKAAGYAVNVVNVHVPPDVSMTRMLRRFDRSGRLVNPDFVKSIGDKPAKTLEQVRQLGIATTRTVDLSANKPPRAPVSGFKAALTGADPRTLQAVTKIAGRAGLVGIGVLAAAKVYQVATRRDETANTAQPTKASFIKADGTASAKAYTAEQREAFMARRKAA